MSQLFSGSALKSRANSRMCGVKIAGDCKSCKYWIAALFKTALFSVLSFKVAIAFNASASITVGAFNCGSNSITAWTVSLFAESPGPIAIALACFAHWSIVGMCCGCNVPRLSAVQSSRFSQSSRLQKTGSDNFA